MAVSEKITLGCLPDRIPAGTIASGGDASATLAAANIQTDDVNQPWRCKYLSSRSTWLRSGWVSPLVAPAIGAVGFVGNLSPSALYRARLKTSTAPTDLWERLAPTGVVSSSNATADDGVSAPDVTEINEDCATALASPNGGTRLKPAVGSNVIFSFGTPGTACLTKVAVQEFRIIAGMQAAGTVGNLTVKVYEAGAAVSGLSWVIFAADLSTTLAEYVFQWDAGNLADESGADVEIRLSTAGSATADILIEALEWNTYPTGAGGATYDTGVLPAYDTFASQQFGDATLADGFTGVNWLHGLPLDSEHADTAYLLLEIWDRDLSSRVHSDYSGATGYHDSSWLPVEVGKLMAGPVYVPTRGMLRAWSIGVKDYGHATRNKLGSSVVRATFKKRLLKFQLKHIPHAEAMQNLFLWGGLYAGKTKPFAVFAEPTRTGVQTLQNGMFKFVGDLDVVNSSPGASAISGNLEEW